MMSLSSICSKQQPSLNDHYKASVPAIGPWIGPIVAVTLVDFKLQ